MSATARWSAIFLVHEKVTQGSSKSAEYRAYRRIAPKSLQLVVVSQPVAQAFCGRLLLASPACRVLYQPAIPVRRMASERKAKLNDALVRILCRFLTPATVTLPDLHDLSLRDNLLAFAGHGDGHVLTVTVALLLAILTGRSDLCIAGVFGAGKTRSFAVLLIALTSSCELDDFSAVVFTRRTLLRKP